MWQTGKVLNANTKIARKRENVHPDNRKRGHCIPCIIPRTEKLNVKCVRFFLHPFYFCIAA